MSVNVKVKRLSKTAVLPKRAHEHDAGLDVFAAEELTLGPRETGRVGAGIALELPPGYVADIRPRSGLTLKSPLLVHYGTIDATFRGEVGIIVENRSPDVQLQVSEGDKIAQIVVLKLPDVQLTEVSELGETSRGVSGFGSTGVSYSDSVAQTLEREVL